MKEISDFALCMLGLPVLVSIVALCVEVKRIGDKFEARNPSETKYIKKKENRIHQVH